MVDVGQSRLHEADRACTLAVEIRVCGTIAQVWVAIPTVHGTDGHSGLIRQVAGPERLAQNGRC